ncbi:hypothetical protein M23134_04970 [Microscilla marina ATCC 23134]|uniref:Uncharacterized protein n=1 Tax=Microscilla marina ATCC 23134 TaxID=313606 RepID=A1ZXG3_MICM2|nr:hypothetical protein M23134_04970 [Microscilla marina ATCC 23134]
MNKGLFFNIKSVNLPYKYQNNVRAKHWVYVFFPYYGLVTH